MNSVNAFFESYTRALENFDAKGLSFLYNIPCTMLSDDATSAFNDAGKLEGFFNQGTVYYRQFGIAHAEHEIWMKREISERITLVKVNWKYFDKDRKPMYNCDYHYTLRLDRNNHWKIILSVSVNEKERLKAWQDSKSRR